MFDKQIWGRRALPAFLLIVACLGSSTRADPPAMQAPSGLVWHKLVLEHITPGEVIRLMHWVQKDEPGKSHGNKLGLPESLTPSTPPSPLPEGVTRIYALASDNSLLVEATPDGFGRIRQIVKNVDIEPRQVQLKVRFVRARIADVEAFQHGQGRSVNDASDLLADLILKGNTVVLSRTTNTVSNVPTTVLFQADVAARGGVVPVRTDVTVSPRVNSDGTLTLLAVTAVTRIVNDPETPGSPSPQQFLNTIRAPHARSLHSGETLVVGGLIHGRQTELLVFITPTLLPQKQAGNDSAQKRGIVQEGPNVSVAP